MKPDRKVAMGAGAGGLAGVIIWALGLAGVEVPPEVAASLATFVFFAVSYLTPRKSGESA